MEEAQRSYILTQVNPGLSESFLTVFALLDDILSI